MSGHSFTDDCPRCGGDYLECSTESKPFDSPEGVCLECGFGYHTVCYLATLDEVNEMRAEEGMDLEPLYELKKPAGEWKDSDWITESPDISQLTIAEGVELVTGKVTPIVSFTGKYRFLSNFYPSKVLYDGEQCRTVEHAYQAAKAVKSNDRLMIRLADTPGQAKRVGRKVQLREHWEEVKVPIMLQLLKQKFGDRALGDKLLATDDAQLIEGNSWGDTYWGVCNGVGTNVLGTLLMQVRDELGKGGTMCG